MGGLLLPSHDNRRGKLYIVGSGPGEPDMLTQRAIHAIRTADYILGNRFYLNQISLLLEGKKVLPGSMGREVDRAQQCIELAREHTVAMVSGGDPGVYGMASIVLEVLERTDYDIAVEIIPGVTAASAGASRLGSPLSVDHVTLSLSDLLTPKGVICERLDLAFRMGVPVVLYNPKSRGRPENLAMALDIALAHRDGDTPVGVVRNAYRDGEEITSTTLAGLRSDDTFVDMHSIVIIGGEETRFMGGIFDARGIITPRGYHRKYVY
jgi:precorrin-3B C17-methyltransferase